LRPDEALRDSEERFRGAFDYSPIGMGLVTLDGRFLRVNPALCRIGGYEESELLGLMFQEIVPGEELEYHRNEVRRLLAREIESYEHEVRYRHKLGHFVWVRFTVSAIRDREGNVTHLLGQAEDISERKQAEERLRQAERLEAVGRLAGGVAHEFNSLLAVIGGFARHALDEAESESLRRDLTEIVDATDRAGQISRQLVTFSRDEVSQPRVLDVNDVVERLEPMLRALIQEGVDLELSLGEGLRPVEVDHAQLERVILNLVVNASDATAEGGCIEIGTHQLEVPPGSASAPQLERGSYIALSVCDTGAGIGADARGRVFDPFFTTKEQGEGAGLGLSAVYGIVDRLGGTVVVDSEPGHGARFTVYLPSLAKATVAPEARADADPGSLAGERGGTETILLVEDEEALRMFIEIVLTEAGYTVVSAVDGEEALARANGNEASIDLVVTDSVMPRVGGRELLQRLRATRADIRVLQISGYSESAVDAEEFLAKPFEPAELLRRVREILDRP
jgi:two-component system, cell cycle sensor histidine kinase and response regulator CckA